MPLGVADRSRTLGDVCGSVEGQEQHPVIVAEHEILIRDDMRSAPCGGERVTLLGVKPLRAGREGAFAEHGKADAAQLARVAVQPPDHDPGESRMLGFEGDEVSDARLVIPT